LSESSKWRSNMPRVRNLRVAVSVVVMSVGVLAGGIVGVTAAAAKTTPKLVVKPAVNLKNGEKVTVSGFGLQARRHGVFC